MLVLFLVFPGSSFELLTFLHTELKQSKTGVRKLRNMANHVYLMGSESFEECSGGRIRVAEK